MNCQLSIKEIVELSKNGTATRAFLKKKFPRAFEESWFDVTEECKVITGAYNKGSHGDLCLQLYHDSIFIGNLMLSDMNPSADKLMFRDGKIYKLMKPEV